MQVEYAGQMTNPVVLSVAPAAPGISSLAQNGRGQGAILNQDLSVNSAARPATRGTIVALFGTGEGISFPTLAPGSLVLSTPYPKMAGPVTATVGGQPAEVLYAGAAPFLATGIAQINVRIPTSIPAGDAIIVIHIPASTTTKNVMVSVN